jgi:hypothetical protein
MGKGMGGGMPVGALPHQPKWWIYWVIIQNWDISPLGAPCHCVSLFSYTARNYWNRPDGQNFYKEKLFKSLLVHPWYGRLEERDWCKQWQIMRSNKRSDFKMSRQRPYFILVTEECAIRITPPLTISDDEIREGCAIMLEVMDEYFCQHKLTNLQ